MIIKLKLSELLGGSPLINEPQNTLEPYLRGLIVKSCGPWSYHELGRIISVNKASDIVEVELFNKYDISCYGGGVR